MGRASKGCDNFSFQPIGFQYFKISANEGLPQAQDVNTGNRSVADERPDKTLWEGITHYSVSNKFHQLI